MDGHSDPVLLAKPGYAAMSDSVNNLPGVSQQVAKIEAAFSVARRYTTSLKTHHGASLLAAGDTVPALATALAIADAIGDSVVLDTAMSEAAAAYSTGVASFSPDSVTRAGLFGIEVNADSELTWAWRAEETFYLNGGFPEWAVNAACGPGTTPGTIANVQAWPGWLSSAVKIIVTGVIKYYAGSITNAKITTIGAQSAEAAGEAESGTAIAGSGIIDWLIGLFAVFDVQAPHGMTQSR